MRKKLLLFVLMLVCVLSASAESVSREEALQKAKAFMQKKGISISEKKDAMVSRAPRRKSKQDASCYYVFNADAGHGFVIVSGDDRTVPVLGYSSSGTFIPDSIPENMRAWLQGYADLIDNLDSLGVTEKYEEPATAVQQRTKTKFADGRLHTISKDMKRAVLPLLTSTWNQDAPYWDNCPLQEYNGRYYYTYTGCVATAMAQVINYHKYPDMTIADIPSYVTRTANINVPGVPAGSVIDWNNMADNYDSYKYMTPASCKAVADLMLYCGVSVEMDYTMRESGAYSIDVGNALKKYFGYDENIYCAKREDYTIAGWDALLYNELINNRPIIYGAQSAGGGHEFVIDGYDGTSLYHVNWGWGGSSDGYFAISVLNPHSTDGIGASSTPDGYSMGQDATIGVQPPGMPNPVSSESSEKLIPRNLTLDGTVLSCEFYNLSYHEDDFELGYTFVNTDTGRSFTISAGWGHLPPKYYFYDISIDVSGLSQPGTYKVYPVSRILNTEEWHIGIDPEYFYALVTKGDGVEVEIHPEVSLSATDFVVPESPAVGQLQTITATVNNHGDEYNGELYFWGRLDGEEEYTLISYTGVAIPKDGSSEITIYLTPKKEKNVHIYISTENSTDESKFIGETVLMFDSEEPVIDLEVLDAFMYNDPVINEKFDFCVEIKNNGDNYNGSLYLFHASDRMLNEEGLVWRGMYYNNVSIAAGETKMIDFSLTPDEVGNYNVWISTDSELENIIASYGFVVSGKDTGILGDVNGDGQLTIADIVSMSKYIADGDDEFMQISNADLTGDGRITVADIVELARRIAEE